MTLFSVAVTFSVHTVCDVMHSEQGCAQVCFHFSLPLSCVGERTHKRVGLALLEWKLDALQMGCIIQMFCGTAVSPCLFICSFVGFFHWGTGYGTKVNTNTEADTDIT